MRFRSPMSANMVLWNVCEVQIPQSECKTPMSAVMVMDAGNNMLCQQVPEWRAQRKLKFNNMRRSC